MFIDLFKQYLHEQCQVNKRDHILAGISGGADSICMLDLLQKSGFPVVVAHFDHHLREESTDDLLFVQKSASDRGLQFITGEGDVRAYAKNHHKTIEEAARILRYEFLFRKTKELNIEIVAVAHTASDQSETILMHILRGCGLEGLKGMLPSLVMGTNPEIRLIRPLLGFWKEDVLSYCRESDLIYIEDTTNSNPEYFRNKLRLQLIPVLREYNPGVERHLYNLGIIAARDLIQLEQLALRNFEDCLIESKTDYVVLSKMRFLQMPYGMRQRVIHKAIGSLEHPVLEMSFDLIEKMIAFIQHPEGKKGLPVILDYWLKIEGDFIYFLHKDAVLPFYNYPAIDPHSRFTLDLNDEKKIHSNWSIRSFVLSEKMNNFPKYDGRLINEAYLDADRVKSPLIVKCQIPGEKYSPFGLKGRSQKISDFWVNKKIPHRFRASWPLLHSDDDIAWIPGFQPSHKYQVTDTTTKVLKIELIRNRSSHS